MSALDDATLDAIELRQHVRKAAVDLKAAAIDVGSAIALHLDSLLLTLDGVERERDAAIARADAADAAIAAVRALPVALTLTGTPGGVRAGDYLHRDDVRRALDTGATT